MSEDIILRPGDEITGAPAEEPTQPTTTATVCPECGGTGVIETGNNDLPCDCPAGDTAVFNVSGAGDNISGAEIKSWDRRLR